MGADLAAVVDHGIGQLRPAAREPAVPAVVLQQQGESQRRGASPALQQDAVLIEQGPEFDQLVHIVR